MQKRFLSGLLILTLYLSLLPVSALADGEPEVAAKDAVVSEMVTDVMEDTGTDGAAEESAETAEPEESDEAKETADEENPAATAEGEEDAETEEASPSDSTDTENTEAVEMISESEEDITTIEETVTEEAETMDSSIVASGTCGTSVNWALDSDGTLTISGTGDMTSYSSSSSAPWYGQRENITAVVIQEGVTSIGSYAFFNCTKMKSIVIPSGVTSIGGNALNGCVSLTAVTIPDTVTTIKAAAFNCCSALTSVTIPGSVESIGDYAFYICTGLKEVVISNGVKTIGASAFGLCESLESITIPDSVTTVGNSVFSCCTSLTSVSIGDGVKTIGAKIFNECTSLTSITVSSANEYFSAEGGFLYNKDKTVLLAVPAGTSSVFIPDGVVTIDEYAFHNCVLTAVRIPSSVSGIVGYAFSSCVNLADIYYAGSESQWDEITIDITGNSYLLDATVHCNITNNDITGYVEISNLSMNDAGVEITWNADTDAEGYYIYRSLTGEDGSYSVIKTITDNETCSYLDETVTTGTTYYYYVRAYSGDFEGAYSGKWITYIGETVTDVANLSRELTYNVAHQDYTWYWADTVKSYLVETSGGYMRVEYTSSTGRITVEYYDTDYNLLSKKYVTRELSIFGGFYAGEDAYYFIFGQFNTDCDDTAEVVRVVKYSLDWERLGQASLYGANTQSPFYAGSCRMCEYGGYLYIRTSHLMYSGHQASMVIQVQTEDMTIADAMYSTSNNSTGYVSHSLNQFILVDDEGNLVALDQGDTYPRGIALGKSALKAGNATLGRSSTLINVFTVQGSAGNNCTGVSLGGFEYSGTSYIAAGNSVAQDDNWSSNSTRNIFVTVTSRSSFSASGTTVNWITDYDEGGSLSASTPQLVKLGSDSFLLLWTTDGDSSTPLHYVYLDGEGNTISSIYSVSGQLSDCQPVVSNGNVVWYVSNYNEMVFYTIEADGTFVKEEGTESSSGNTEGNDGDTASSDTSGNITIGDINMDGTVSGKDLIYLRQYLAGNGVTIDETAADVNQDGEISGKDLIYLRKLLAD